MRGQSSACRRRNVHIERYLLTRSRCQWCDQRRGCRERQCVDWPTSCGCQRHGCVAADLYSRDGSIFCANGSHDQCGSNSYSHQQPDNQPQPNHHGQRRFRGRARRGNTLRFRARSQVAVYVRGYIYSQRGRHARGCNHSDGFGKSRGAGNDSDWNRAIRITKNLPGGGSESCLLSFLKSPCKMN